jgi:hypothetical protein
VQDTAQRVLVLASVIATDLDRVMPWQRNDDVAILAQVAFEAARAIQAQRARTQLPRHEQREQLDESSSRAAAKRPSPAEPGAARNSTASTEEWGARTGAQMADDGWRAAESRAADENRRWGAGSPGDGDARAETRTGAQMADEGWRAAESRAADENRRWGAGSPGDGDGRAETRTGAQMAEEAWDESSRRADEENRRYAPKKP